MKYTKLVINRELFTLFLRAYHKNPSMLDIDSCINEAECRFYENGAYCYELRAHETFTTKAETYEFDSDELVEVEDNIAQ